MARRNRRHKPLTDRPPLNTDPPPEWLTEKLEREGYEGKSPVSDDVSDFIWIGGSDGMEPVEEVEKQFEKAVALREILLAIIDAHPNAQLPRGRKYAVKTEREVRLEQAIRFLTGEKPVRGAPKPDYQEALAEIAARYWRAILRIDDPKTSLSQIVEEVIFTNEREDIDYKTRNDRVAPYLKAFKRDKHRLMLEASDGRDRWERVTRPKVEKIVDLMKALGILDGS